MGQGYDLEEVQQLDKAKHIYIIKVFLRDTSILVETKCLAFSEHVLSTILSPAKQKNNRLFPPKPTGFYTPMKILTGN